MGRHVARVNSHAIPPRVLQRQKTPHHLSFQGQRARRKRGQDGAGDGKEGGTGTRARLIPETDPEERSQQSQRGSPSPKGPVIGSLPSLSPPSPRGLVDAQGVVSVNHTECSRLPDSLTYESISTHAPCTEGIARHSTLNSAPPAASQQPMRTVNEPPASRQPMTGEIEEREAKDRPQGLTHEGTQARKSTGDMGGGGTAFLLDNTPPTPAEATRCALRHH